MSALKSPRNAPRRKAGSKALRRKGGKTRFRLIVEAQEMLVEYQPNWSDGEFAQGHFEFSSPHKPARRIIVSETGYHSHFVSMQRIAMFESPQAYARNFVYAVLDSNAKRRHDADSERQLSLF